MPRNPSAMGSFSPLFARFSPLFVRLRPAVGGFSPFLVRTERREGNGGLERGELNEERGEPAHERGEAAHSACVPDEERGAANKRGQRRTKLRSAFPSLRPRSPAVPASPVPLAGSGSLLPPCWRAVGAVGPARSASAHGRPDPPDREGRSEIDLGDSGEAGCASDAPGEVWFEPAQATTRTSSWMPVWSRSSSKRQEKWRSTLGA
jgi:hypothetical protein